MAGERVLRFARLMTVELWLSFIYASYNGAMVVFLTELIPAKVRASGFSIAYSLATAIFGGSTPALCTYLIHETGNRGHSRTLAVFCRRDGFGGGVLHPQQDQTPDESSE